MSHWGRSGWRLRVPLVRLPVCGGDMSIVKMTDSNGQEWYIVRSAMLDRPMLPALTLDELKEAWRDEYGRAGQGNLKRALRRLDEKGTSSLLHEGFRDTLETCNRAGKGGTWLSAEQQLQLCITRRRVPDAEMNGVPHDMICCYCGQPIASEADRTWAGDDPAHWSCMAHCRKVAEDFESRM